MERELKGDSNRDWVLFGLSWPIFIELLLHLLMGNVDTWMLGLVSDQAVASVGVANQILMSVTVLFGFVATGTGVIVAQSLGASQRDAAQHVARTALAMNLWVGIVISLAMVVCGSSFLNWMEIPQELIPNAQWFLSIVGGMMVTEALMMTISAVVRAHGLTKQVMWVTIGMNVVNIAGNVLVLFGPFALHGHEVVGIAVSTTVSRVLGLLGVVVILRRNVNISLKLADLIHFSSRYVNRLLSIGVPSAGEQMSYQTSQLYMTFLVTLIGSQALATKIYVQNITFLILLFSVSISAGTQILIGYLIGAGNKREAYDRGLRSLYLAMGISVVCSAIVWWFSPHLLDLFTNDEAIILLGQKIMLMNLILEPGRCLNLVLIGALRAAGDTKLPVVMGILSMWGVSVPLAYWFGVRLEYGLVGIYFAFAIDEWLRGLTMYWRWQSRIWEKKADRLPGVDAHFHREIPLDA